MNNVTKLIFISTIVFIISFSGCVGIDLNQKIFRDETSDINLRFTAETPLILNALKDEVTKNLSSESDWVYSEDEKGFTLALKNTDIKTLKSSTMGKGIFSQAELKKEFKFPYYYFTYSFIETANQVEEQKSTEPYDSEEFKKLVSINYNLEVFGDVVETNGLKTGENTVRFKLELEPNKDKKYYVTFKDFFLRTWLKI